ncbi:hypothetical protein JavanS176_0003 [Streptococcus satellite phage Javan176]|uniref:hypothetical protein n=1 Tax=Streptococcus entericus TaxID=155680 RepID=UPI00037A6AAD|nr:hypothetical protein [Streptococcus entericus]QBX07764.1 hypothetical protein JavanS176_0003 [Streptococcus satellite phage Javan176]
MKRRAIRKALDTLIKANSDMLRENHEEALADWLAWLRIEFTNPSYAKGFGYEFVNFKEFSNNPKMMKAVRELVRTYEQETELDT